MKTSSVKKPVDIFLGQIYTVVPLLCYVIVTTLMPDQVQGS